MCGGDARAFETIKPVAMAFSRAVTLLGGRRRPARQDGQPDLHRRAGAGPGRRPLPSAEGRAGHEGQVLDVIGKGAAQSWQMDNRGKTMVDDQFDFGFAVDWMRKDLGLVLDEAGAMAPACR